MLPCFLFISFISYLIHLFFFPFAPLFSILCSFPNLLNPSFTLPLQCEATVCMFIFCHLSFLLLCSRSALTRLLAFSFRQCIKLGSGHRQSHRTVITDQWNDPHGPVNHTHTHTLSHIFVHRHRNLWQLRGSLGAVLCKEAYKWSVCEIWGDREEISFPWLMWALKDRTARLCEMFVYVWEED